MALVFNFVMDLYMLPEIPHCYACLRLHALTLAHVCAKDLLIITSTLKSALYSLCWLVFDRINVVIQKRLISCCSFSFSICPNFLTSLIFTPYILPFYYLSVLHIYSDSILNCMLDMNFSISLLNHLQCCTITTLYWIWLAFCL